MANLRGILGSNDRMHLALVTTRWDLCPEPEVGEARENELKTTLWGQEVKQHALVFRLQKDEDSAWAVIDAILANYKLKGGKLELPDLDQLQARVREETPRRNRLMQWLARRFA